MFIHIHLLSNVFLIGSIYMFDKDVKKWFKKDKKLFFYLCLSIFGSNLIDLDHLLSSPIYDPTRCSINNHILHSWYIFPVWIIGLFFRNKFVRYFCLGVILHLFLDFIDCLFI